MQRILDMLSDHGLLGLPIRIRCEAPKEHWSAMLLVDGEWMFAYSGGGSLWECIEFRRRYEKASAEPEIYITPWGDPVCCN